MENPNKIIPPLMDLFDQYDGNLNNRIKANSIIFGFDDDANKTFSKFVNLSNARFKAIKYGGNLEYVLNKQKPNYTNINSDVQKDVVYTTDYVTSEKKKFGKSVNHFCIKKINKLRDKLIDSLKTKTKVDLRVMEKIKKSQKFKNYAFNRNLRKKNVKFLDQIAPVTESEQIIEEKEKFSPNEQLDEDYEKLTNGIKRYQKLLNEIKVSNNGNVCKIREDKNIKTFRKRCNEIESSFAFNNIKFLSYVEQKRKTRVKKKEIDENFDLNNLRKIKYIHQNIQHLNSDNSNDNVSYTHSKENSMAKNNFSIGTAYSNSNILTDGNVITKNNLISNNSNLNSASNNRIVKPELKNTIQLIKFEAEKGTSLYNNFENKIVKFNEYFNKYFPMSDISNKEREIKLRFRKIKQDEKICIPKLNVDIKKRRKTTNKKQVNEERIIESFRKIYEEKKIDWNKLFAEKQQEEQANIKRNAEFDKFLMRVTK